MPSRIVNHIIIISASSGVALVRGTRSLWRSARPLVFTWNIHLKTFLAVESLSTYGAHLVVFRSLSEVSEACRAVCKNWMCYHVSSSSALNCFTSLASTTFLAKRSSHPPPCGRDWTSLSSASLFALWFSFRGHGYLLWRSHLLPDGQCPSWYGMFESHPCVFSCTQNWASSRLSDGPRSTCP